MRAFLLLFKIQALSLFGINRLRHARDASQKKRAITVFASFACGFAALAMFSFLISFGIAIMGQANSLPVVSLALMSIVSVFLTLFEVNGILFSYRDYDSVMSLPVKPSSIILSRLAALYVTNLAFALCAMLPAAAVYSAYTVIPLRVYAIQFTGILIAPFIPIAAAAVVGAVITLIVSRLPFRSFFSVALTMAFVLALMYFAVYMENESAASLSNIGESIESLVISAYPPALLYRNAVTDADFLQLLLFAALSVSTVGVFCLIAGSFYRSVNGRLSARAHNKDYTITELAVSPPFAAQYKKELRRFISCTVYVSNSCFPALMPVVLSVLALFADIPSVMIQAQKSAGDAFSVSQLLNAAPFAFALLASLTPTTAASVSMEGRSKWIMQSVPIRPDLIYKAKIAVNLTVYLPGCVMGGILFSFALGYSPVRGVLMVLIPSAFCLFSSITGLFFNLLLPKFDWTSDFHAVKNSASGLCTMLVCLAVCGVFLFLGIITSEFSVVFQSATLVFILVICYVLYGIIKNKYPNTRAFE